ncbi:MAG TPA: glycosyltransferase [Pyrinomonadaceae bacterium]|nr:glycosyltransferase [Pyrinomonadaceae bacterium]
MTNVLQLIGSFHQGGSERQAVQLTWLLHEDKTVKVFAATLNKEGVLLPEIESLDLPQIPEFKLTSFYDANFLKQIRLCAKYIKENQIEIVHSHDFYTNIFGVCAASLAGINLKITSKRETGGMRSRLQKIIEKQAFRSSNKIVVNSEAVKNYLIAENVSAKKINVIYNGLDLERLTPKIFDRKAICAELNLPNGENLKFITLVANLRHEVKNQPMFLRVAQKVAEKFPNAHFVIAGEGELRESLEKLARELKVEKNVHFIGRCAMVPELLALSYACVLTSFNEGFSNSILEYMAAGKPVVATNVGGASEAIIENETGFLVDSDDDVKMAEKLIYLLENEEITAKFGETGKRIAHEKFSLKTQLDKTLELYRF